MNYSPRKVMAAVIMASAAAHAVAIIPDSIRYPAGKLSEFGSALADRYERYQIGREREALVEDARAALREGRLNLGEFIIKGNGLDAREGGEEPDLGNALIRYNDLLDSLFRAVNEGKQPYESIPEILGGMDYYGIPGGTVLDALEQNGGSCGQYAPLIASLLYDANYRDESFMRIYGANSDGVGHVSPIYRHEGKEYDLMAGGYSDMRGTLFPAAEIVEAYARAHGLAPPLPPAPAGPSGVPGAADSTSKQEAIGTLPGAKPSGLDLPPGKDSYESSAPLFAKGAIKQFNPQEEDPGPSQAGPEGSLGSGAHSDAAGPEGLEKNEAPPAEKGNETPAPPPEAKFYLNPQNLARLPGGVNPALIRVHPVDIPTPDFLDGLSARIELERKQMLAQIGWKRILAMGTLAGLYSEAYWNFKLAGKEALAEAAASQRDKTVKGAVPLLEEAPTYRKYSNSGAEAPYLDPTYNARWWPLAYLGQRGDDAFFTMWEDQRGHLTFLNLAYFLAKEPSRQRALEIIGRLTVGQQAAILPMLEGADIEGPQDILRAYKIYNHVTEFFLLGNASARGESSAGKSETPSYVVTLKKGQGMPLAGITVRFEGMSSDGAVIGVSLGADEGGLRQQTIRQGETGDFSFEFSGLFSRGTLRARLKVLSIEPEIMGWGTRVRLEVRFGEPETGAEKEILIARGVMNAGQALTLGSIDYMFRFESFDNEAKRVGILVLSRSRREGDIEVERLWMREGETSGTSIYYPKKGEMGKQEPEVGRILVRLNGLQAGATSHDTKIDLALLMGEAPPSKSAWMDDFTGLKEKVERECDFENLGEGWKTALTNVCAIWMVANGKTGPDNAFIAGYREWLSYTRGKRRTLGIPADATIASDPAKDTLYIFDLWEKSF